jgi:hypothetical protein
MSNTNTDKATLTVSETVAISINPLDLLTAEQLKALGARFNKTWLMPRQQQVESLMEHGFNFFTAAFTQALREDANNLISAKRIASAADRMATLASELFGSEANVAEALRGIEAAYESLEPIQQPAAGKRFRTLVMKGYTSNMNSKILGLVTAKLDVREAEWC